VITLGIDVGSVSTEALLLEDGDIRWSARVDTGSSSGAAVDGILSLMSGETGLRRADIDRTVTTGYGRNATSCADRSVTEITCHARGAFRLDGRVRTVVDIGGQDSKVIRVDRSGRSEDFLMNDKCAAGTGRFLEIIARTLDLDVADLGDLAMQTGETVKISSICAVFAESEVVTLVAKGCPVEVILRGIAEAVASRVAGMAARLGVENPVMLTGGVALNGAVVRALGDSLGLPVQVPDDPQIVGALGAACVAADEAR
jgi:predicted CoA-substrate-specific enzyme activase